MYSLICDRRLLTYSIALSKVSHGINILVSRHIQLSLYRSKYRIPPGQSDDTHEVTILLTIINAIFE